MYIYIYNLIEVNLSIIKRASQWWTGFQTKVSLNPK